MRAMSYNLEMFERRSSVILTSKLIRFLVCDHVYSIFTVFIVDKV